MEQMLKLFIQKFWVSLLCCFGIFSIQAQVGINTTSPKTTLDVNGAISLREGTALTLANGTNSNINLGTVPYSLYRITGPTAAFSITGIVPVSGADGQIVVLQNTTSQTMTLVNDATSTAANRIFIPGSKDLLLRGAYTTVSLQYVSSLSRWVLLDKMNHIETWYHGPVTIAAGYNTITATITSATTASSSFVSFVGPITTANAANLSIQYVESQSGQVIFRVYNSSASSISNISFAITINKI